MEIDKVLALVASFNSPRIIDRVEWIKTTIEFLKEMDAKYKEKYLIINVQLESKILEIGFLSLFKSYPANENRLDLLLKFYDAPNFKAMMLTEVDEFEQGTLNIKIYYNQKIALLLLCGIARDDVVMMTKITAGLLPSDRKKLGYDTMANIAELSNRIDRIEMEIWLKSLYGQS